MTVKIDNRTDILALIDIQPTFMPGGELAVQAGDGVVPVVNQLMAEVFAHAFAAQDWHPPGHSSFASSHPGAAPFSEIDMPYGRQTLWPDHALQGSPNAELHPALDRRRIEFVVRKGYRPEIDSYSAFFENDRRTPTGLAGALRERGFKRVFFTGLALDYCVAYSAEDAITAGFEAYVVVNASRGIAAPLPGQPDRTTLHAAWDRMEAKGVRFVNSFDLV